MSRGLQFICIGMVYVRERFWQSLVAGNAGTGKEIGDYVDFDFLGNEISMEDFF